MSLIRCPDCGSSNTIEVTVLSLTNKLYLMQCKEMNCKRVFEYKDKDGY